VNFFSSKIPFYHLFVLTKFYGILRIFCNLALYERARERGGGERSLEFFPELDNKASGAYISATFASLIRNDEKGNRLPFTARSHHSISLAISAMSATIT